MTTHDEFTASSLFELELEIPNQHLQNESINLIGFNRRYQQLHQDLNILMDTEGVQHWSRKYYGKVLPLVERVIERYPLIIFYGDVGTGKTATAEAAANQLASSLKKEGHLYKLSTRVRGSGHVGQMSLLINQAFEAIISELGKNRVAFLILDEADSIASSRAQEYSHHEDKVAVNTLIQRIDELRRFQGRFLVFLCTNRFSALDPAIIRRASRILEFQRPNEAEREEFFELDCADLDLSAVTLRELIALTGPQPASRSYGFTYSDLRTRLLPEALSRAYPTRAMTADDLLYAARNMIPSPPIGE